MAEIQKYKEIELITSIKYRDLSTPLKIAVWGAYIFFLDWFVASIWFLTDYIIALRMGG